jgi:hypothetical protein
VVDGVLYVVGQYPGSSGLAGANEAFDPATDSWASLAPVPTPRHGLGVVTLDDAIYVASGGPQRGATFSDALEIFALP